MSSNNSNNINNSNTVINMNPFMINNLLPNFFKKKKYSKYKDIDKFYIKNKYISETLLFNNFTKNSIYNNLKIKIPDFMAIKNEYLNPTFNKQYIYIISYQ